MKTLKQYLVEQQNPKDVHTAIILLGRARDILRFGGINSPEADEIEAIADRLKKGYLATPEGQAMMNKQL
jgi:hypothetical protein